MVRQRNFMDEAKFHSAQSAERLTGASLLRRILVSGGGSRQRLAQPTSTVDRLQCRTIEEWSSQTNSRDHAVTGSTQRGQLGKLVSLRPLLHQ